MPVSGFSVQNLETLSLSADVVFRVWERCVSHSFLVNLALRGSKRCACQRIWCSMSRNVVPVSGFGVQNLETLRLSADLVFKI